MRTRILATVLAWVGAVVTVAAIAWFAIDVAGQQLIADPVALPLAAPTGVPTGAGEVASVPIQTTSPVEKSPSKSVEKSSGSSPPTSATSGASEAVITQENTPSADSSTFSTIGGRIRARCDGARITLAGGFAQPASGWAVKVLDGGPEQIRVRFDHDDRPSVLVVADCVDGRPMFEQSRIERNADDDESGSVRSRRKE